MSITSNLFRSCLLASSIASLALVPACGGDSGADIDASDNGGGDDDDGMTTGGGDVDADPSGGGNGDGGGTTGDTQCSNGIDDDGDGATDGFDPECTSAEDNDEGSFATGIPGDNMDAVNQDCFFDGDSGAGNDGCNIHVCCLLDDPNTPEPECPEDLKPDQYDPEQCTPSQQCIDFCQQTAPPGCDCFGCCTICNDADECQDVLLEASCDANDFSTCTTCTKVTECSSDCEVDTEDCILCPGETEEDLPDTCGGMNECPAGQAVCSDTMPCEGADEFCASGCCVVSSPE